MLNMICLSRVLVWNTKGLTVQRKRNVVIETLVKYMSNMVILLETKIDAIPVEKF